MIFFFNIEKLSQLSLMVDLLEYWRAEIQTDAFNQKKTLFQDQLIAWFKVHGRDLPWRHTHDPYQILVSELMLQQTQVDRVAKDYYFQFLDRFPTFESIANATEEEVVESWGGLGYYNRARNLHKLAQEIMTKHNGQFPQTKDEILQLPGIGEYTTGAVMTFALQIRAPIVDTNVDRVFSRVFLNTDKKMTDNQKTKILWLLAEELLPEVDFWEFNQGIMDLGALICISDKPLCAKCPMELICLYYKRNSLNRFFKV
jgi:A/G-specific adenine glycosylase